MIRIPTNDRSVSGVPGATRPATPWSESPAMIGQYQVSRGNETRYPMIRIPSNDRSVSGVPGQQDTLPHDQNPQQWQVSIRCPGVTRHTTPWSESPAMTGQYQVSRGNETHYPMIRIPTNDRSVSGVPGQRRHATPWSESPPMTGQYQVSRGNKTRYPMIRIPSNDRSVSGVPG